MKARGRSTLLLAAGGACLMVAGVLLVRGRAARRSADPAPATLPAPRVSIADSVPFGDGLAEGVLYRIAVSHAGRTDTIPGLLVATVPVVTPDGAVVGIRADDELAAGLFAYHPASRRLQELPLPHDWWSFTSPRLAPDGRHVAYLAQGAAGPAYVAVATTNDGQLVYRGPALTPLETDSGVDDIRWGGPDRFEVRVDLTIATGGVQRVRGTLVPLRVVVDTVHE